MTDDTSNSPSSARQRQFDEILAALMRAIDAGQSVNRDAWLAQHPDFTAELKEFFAKHERLEKLVRPLRQAAAHVLHVRCPHCHNPIELLDEAPLSDISCPSCGSSFSLIGDNTLSHDPRTKSFGHFELLDRVGMGQFGSVWKARDTKLDRTVAIKIPRNGRMDAAQTEMFLRDARAAAQLKHPNIVSVHEVGKQEDTVYIVSDFVQGATLKEWTDAKRLTPREAAELCVKIAKALHHAHEAGVIHRDLKPSNIMLEVKGQGTSVKSQTNPSPPALDSGLSTLDLPEPHIVDFGLAKREAGEITMTVEGQILGTPAYMSPEQARGEGHRVDRRADVYSLGVVLFELLTGELPFRGDKQMLLVQILKDDPPSPRKLNGNIPRDLETICLKCLEKDPSNRYGTAQQVAAEFERWLGGRSIIARPVGKVERIAKWIHRKPATAALVGVSLFASLLLMVGLAISNVLINDALRDRTIALRDLKSEEEATVRALTERTQAHQELQLEQQKTTTALQRESDALDAATERQRDLYRSMVKLAHAQAFGNDIALADNNLESVPEELRGWEWLYAKRLCHPDVLTIAGQASAGFTPDGQHIVICAGDRIELRAVPTGEVELAFEGHTSDVQVVAISPDGKRIASSAADHAVWIWDATSGEHQATIQSPYHVLDIAFSPNHERIVVANDNSMARVWSLESGQVVHTLEGHNCPVVCVAYSPDGESLISGSSPNASLKVWNASNGIERTEFEGLITLGIGLEGQDNSGVRAVAFGPDAKTLAVANADVVRLIDLETNTELKTLAGHVGGIHSVAFNREGRLLASASSDGTIKIWDVEAGRSIRTLPWHNGVVRSVSFSPNGNWLVSCSDTEVKLWDLSTNWAITKLQIHTDAVYALGFSRDGRFLVSGGGRYYRDKDKKPPPDTNGEVRVVDLANNEVVFSKDLDFPFRFGVLAVAINADATKVAASGYIGTRVWETRNGVELLHLSERNAQGEISTVCFGPDENHITTASKRADITIRDLATGNVVRTFPSRGSARFSPDNRFLSVCYKDLTVWDYESQEQQWAAKIQSKDGGRRSAWRLAYSPDGTKIVVSLDTRRVNAEQKNEFANIFDANTGELLRTLTSNIKRDYGEEEYISSVYGASYAPDGKRIATASGDKTVRIWDAETGHELLILDHPNQVFCVEFSPDGRRLATASGHWTGPRAGEVRIFNAF